jgi:hypothetical protein
VATRIHGKYTMVLMSSTATGPFQILGSVNEVTINRTPDRVDTTSFGDTAKTSVTGFPEANIDFRGFYDLDDTVLKTARLAPSGVMVGVYPNYAADKTKYWAALCDVEFGYSSGSTAAQTTTGSAYARQSPVDNL